MTPIKVQSLLQVVEDVPYVTPVSILDEHNCDFCAHGGKPYTCRCYVIFLIIR